MDWGAVIAGAIGGGANAVGTLANNAIEDERKSKLMTMQKDLELQKAQAAAKFAQTMQDQHAAQERSRVQGIVQSASDKFQGPGGYGERNGMDVASDQAQGAPAPQVRYSDVSREAAAQGDLGTAQTFDKMADSGMKSTAYGAVTHDAEGKVIYDNSLGRQQADMVRAQGKGPKVIDQGQLEAMTKRAQEIVGTAYKGLQDPFASATSSGNERLDTAIPRVMGTTIGRMIENAAGNGQMLAPATALHRLQPIMRAANAQVVAAANKRAAQVFDKNKVRPEYMEVLQASGAPTDDPLAFKQWYRENNLESTFMSLVTQAKSGGGQPAPAKPAATPPAPVPGNQAGAKPEGSWDDPEQSQYPIPIAAM